MIMNLPTISSEYAWQVENHLTTENLARNEVRIRLVAAHPTLILRRHRVLLAKTVRIKNPARRVDKIEHAARKLLKKFQKAAYVSNVNDYNAYLAAENMRRDRYNQYS